MTDDVQITYGLKEILTRLDAKIDNFLESQHRQDQTLADHGNRITALETARSEGKTSYRFRVPLFISLGTTLVSPFLWWGISHIH